MVLLYAPSKNGYTILYWRGSMYYPGEKYKEENNHTFTAIWGVIPPEPLPPYVPPQTGDR